MAIDANDYRKVDRSYQYCKHHFDRELNKAYIGFYPLEDENEPLAPVSTGNWVYFLFYFILFNSW